MRLSPAQARQLKQLAIEEAGPARRRLLFGSRLDDAARGGDVFPRLDLVHPVTPPAPLAARLAARASHASQGRHVNVLLSAPNPRRLPIHEVALRTGVEL